MAFGVLDWLLLVESKGLLIGCSGMNAADVPDDPVCGNGEEASSVGMSSGSGGNVGCPKTSGTGTLSASAIAAVIDEALEKRISGSFARLRIITCTSVGGRFGLMSVGAVGMALTCCLITSSGVLP